MTWKEALERLRAEHLGEIPQETAEALSDVLATRGRLYRAIKKDPALQANPASEQLAVAMECAATALTLHRQALAETGWSAASRLLLGDGLLTLAFELVGREPTVDFGQFSGLISQLLGEEDPERRMEELFAHNGFDTAVRDKRHEREWRN